MSQIFNGQVALITGAGRGLGRAYAGYLAARGAKVIVQNRQHADHPSAAHLVADELRAKGCAAEADTHPIETPEGAHAMVEGAIRRWGKLDILICNAGVGQEHRALQDLSPDQLRGFLDINLWGTIWPLQAALRAMVPAGYGRIVMTTSAAGLYGQKGSASYGTAKSALVGLARSVAQDNRDRDIKINLISPYARTEMAKDINPALGDLMAPEQVAPVVAYLASPACQRSWMILAAGSGRVRRIQITEGPILAAPREVLDDWRELDREGAPFAPTSTRNSALALTPELLGHPAPL